MSEVTTEQPPVDGGNEISAAQKIRRVIAAGLATILPVSGPVLAETEVTWNDRVVENSVTPGATHDIVIPTSGSEIIDKTGHEIPSDKLPFFLTFRLTKQSEQKEFESAIAEIIKTDSDVTVVRDGADVLIRTGDFARHPLDTKPREDQVTNLVIGIDGTLLYGVGSKTRRVIEPDKIISTEHETQHTIDVPIIVEMRGVMPKEPEIEDKGGPEDNDPTEPEAPKPPEPPSDTSIPGHDPEDTPTVVDITDPPSPAASTAIVARPPKALRNPVESINLPLER